MEERMVRLPIGSIQVRPTGRRMPVRDIPDAGLFAHDGEVWEKMGTSNACLSNMDDESDVLPHVMVDELVEVPQPGRKGRHARA